MKKVLLSFMLLMFAHPAFAEDVPFITNETLEKYNHEPRALQEDSGEQVPSVPYANAEVKKVTDDYLKLYKAGEPAKAYKLYWNWDLFCTKSFGKNYTSLKSSEKIQAQELVLSIGTNVFLDKNIVTEMRKAKFVNQNTRIDKNKNVEFSFETIFQDGTSGGKSTLYMNRVNNKVWFVDMYANGLLSFELGDKFESVKDKITLLSFLNMTQNESLAQLKIMHADWLHGTWELTYDPDKNDKDWMVFSKFGKVILKGSTGPSVEGFYSIKDNRLILGFNIKNKVREIDMTISNDKSKLTNKSGAYYTRISKSTSLN